MASTNEYPPPSLATETPIEERQENDPNEDPPTVDAMAEDSQAPNKKRARRTASNPGPRKRVKGRQGALKGLMKLPIEIFTQIAYHLAPADLVTLSWSNKFFRELLLRRSSSKLWKWAEGNVPGLPPCPAGMNEPQYAVLVFTKYCTLCGASATGRLDPYLHARLCASCRNGMLMVLNSWRTPEHVDKTLVARSECTGMKMKAETRYRGFHPVFGLRPEVDEVSRKQQEFRDAGNIQGLVQWEEGKRESVRQRLEHANELRLYLESTNKSRTEELDNIKTQRRDTIKERMRALGWTNEDMKFEFFGFSDWRSLVDVPKPLTERIWQNLLPKLIPLLEENHKQLEAYKVRERRTARRQCVHTFLSKTMHVKHPLEEMAKLLRGNPPESTISKVDSDSLRDYKLDRLLPSSYLALTWDSLADFNEREITLDQVKEELKARESRLQDEILEWRARVARQLVDIFCDTTGNNSEGVVIKVKGSTNFGLLLSSDQRLLLRADTVFKFVEPNTETKRYWWIDTKDKNQPRYYPWMVTMLYENLSEQASRYISQPEPKPARDVNLKVFERNSKIEGIVKLLLRDLNMPDVTRMELLAMESRFICGRCVDGIVGTWDEMINHYLNAPNLWEELKAKVASPPTRHPIAYLNIHDLDPSSPKPFVRIISKEEASSVRSLHSAYRQDDSVCFPCRATSRSYRRFLTTSDAVSHVQDVHSIPNPVENLHYGKADKFVRDEWPGRWDEFYDGETTDTVLDPQSQVTELASSPSD